MSLLENTSALKIQKAYRKYYESKDPLSNLLKNYWFRQLYYEVWA